MLSLASTDANLYEKTGYNRPYGHPTEMPTVTVCDDSRTMGMQPRSACFRQDSRLSLYNR